MNVINPIQECERWPFNLLSDLTKTSKDLKPFTDLPSDFSGSLEYVLLSLKNQRNVGILRMRYEQYLSLQEIACITGLSKECIRQIVLQMLQELQKPEWIRFLQYGVGEIIKTNEEMSNILVVRTTRVQTVEKPETKDEAAKESPLDLKELNLSTGVYHALMRRGIQSVPELLKLNHSQFINIKRIGKKGRLEIISALEQLHFNCANLKFGAGK